MWNGADGSLDGHYDLHVREFGIGGYVATQGSPTAAQLTMAHTMFTEFDTAYSKTNGSVNDTAGVRAARDQMFDKFR